MGYAEPDAVRLIGEVQQEYVVRYGGGDETPLDPDHFELPEGLFAVGYLDGEPVACGGWRVREGGHAGLLDGDAELKRMYVVPSARGRGLARRILRYLEDTAAEAGRSRVVLETGLKQPEAIALYESAGYEPIEKFGIYRDSPHNLCLARKLS